MIYPSLKSNDHSTMIEIIVILIQTSNEIQNINLKSCFRNIFQSTWLHFTYKNVLRTKYDMDRIFLSINVLIEVSDILFLIFLLAK